MVWWVWWHCMCKSDFSVYHSGSSQTLSPPEGQSKNKRDIYDANRHKQKVDVAAANIIIEVSGACLSAYQLVPSLHLLSSGCVLPSLRWHLLRPLPGVRTWGQGRRQVPAHAQETRQSIHLHPCLRPDAALPVFLQICYYPQLWLCGKTSANSWLDCIGARCEEMQIHRSDLLSSPPRSLQPVAQWQPCTLHMDLNTDTAPPPQHCVSTILTVISLKGGLLFGKL